MGILFVDMIIFCLTGTGRKDNQDVYKRQDTDRRKRISWSCQRNIIKKQRNNQNRRWFSYRECCLLYTSMIKRDVFSVIRIKISLDMCTFLAWMLCSDQFKRRICDPVSYTHLDVYKRQCLVWWCLNYTPTMNIYSSIILHNNLICNWLILHIFTAFHAAVWVFLKPLPHFPHRPFAVSSARLIDPQSIAYIRISYIK